MQRCTFVPQTNAAILRAQGPVLVRGLGRHLELKDVAQQREMERREREAQAFGVRPGAVKRTMVRRRQTRRGRGDEGEGWMERREDRRGEHCCCMKYSRKSISYFVVHNKLAPTPPRVWLALSPSSFFFADGRDLGGAVQPEQQQ